MLFTHSKTNHAAFAPRVKDFSKYFTGLLISVLLLGAGHFPGNRQSLRLFRCPPLSNCRKSSPTALHPPHIELLMKCYGRKIARPNRETTNGADLQSNDKKSHRMVM
jgi:hypothetical protein